MKSTLPRLVEGIFFMRIRNPRVNEGESRGRRDSKKRQNSSILANKEASATRFGNAGRMGESGRPERGASVAAAEDASLHGVQAMQSNQYQQPAEETG